MSAPSPRWILHVGEECELCDRAVEVLAAAHAPDFACIGIEGDEELTLRYGERVPVLCDTRNGRELGWPFDVARVRAFFDECRQTDGAMR